MSTREARSIALRGSQDGEVMTAVAQDKELHYDYTIDDDDDHVQHVIAHVFDWMKFDHTYTGNFRHSWMIDPIHGVCEIIFMVAATLDEYEAELVHHVHDQQHPDYLAARGFANAVYCAICRLIETGYAEIAIEFGWASVRLTRKAVEHPSEWIPGAPLEREIAERDRIAELRAMPYAEYLRTDEWRYRRDIHIEAAGGRCQLCNSAKAPLHVHHRTYEDRGREKFYDLVALCATCHTNFHSDRKAR